MNRAGIVEVPIITTFEKFRTKMAETLNKARKKSKPIFLTKKGKIEGVIMDTATYEDLVKRLKEWSLLDESVKDIKNKRTRPAEEVFDTLLKEYE